MSIITRIRNNGWIIVVALTLGMGGFLLQDAFNSKTGLFGGMPGIGIIDGREITPQMFYEKEKELFEGRQGGNTYEQRSSLWDYLVQTTLAENLATRMGLSIGSKELESLMTDPVSLSPAVQRRFMNQQTGQMDQQGLAQFVELYKSKTERAKLRPEGVQFIKSLEADAVTTALTQKVIGMVQKSIYTPKWMADMEQVKTQPFDFKYVPVPYAAIPDAQAPVTDAELKSYISAHSALYTRDEETRDVAYALLMAVPSTADSTVIRTEINTLADSLRASRGEKSDSAFCANNYGTFNGMYFSKKDIPGSLGDTAFKFPVGSVVGPYAEQGFFRVVKIVTRQAVVDSVKSRHILIPVKQGESDVAAKARIDSFKMVIASGAASFDTLARKFGTDATKEKGGDLGFAGYGGMVKEFNDLIFFAAVPRQLYTVKTQLGWHLVEVMEKKGSTERVKLAFINKAIVPSKETENEIYNKAQTFAQKNRTVADLQKNAAAAGFRFGTAKDLKINDYTAQDLEPSDAARNIVKWAYSDEAEVSGVSAETYAFIDPVNAYVNKYVVAGLKRIVPKGIAQVADVRDEVTAKVRNMKKAEIIKKKIGTQTDMTAIAGMFQSEIKEAGQVTMATPVVPGLGAEPKAIAAAIATDLNKVSKPIAGENGVFVVMPVSKPVAAPVQDYAMLRRQLDGQVKQQAGGAFFQALRKNANIKDTRNQHF